jgi:probable F420-dependent oxidoreductase
MTAEVIGGPAPAVAGTRSGATHPFRFAVTAPLMTHPLAAWRDSLRRIEDIGFGTIVMADHFTQGYEIEPMVGLTAAATCTSTVRLQTGVLGNDYRHPVLVHRMAAALDLVSDGRLVLGLGAGWMLSDYEAAGLDYDPPGERVSRFEEAVTVVKGLFRNEPLTLDGRYYRIRGLDGRPKPIQRPHPPIFIGGGSPRVLRFAGREADMVGINASLKAGATGRHTIVDLTAERIAEKVSWIREGAEAARRPFADIELEMNNWLVRVTPSSSAASEFLARIAAKHDVDPRLLADSPSVLVGTAEQCIETLLARRESLGLSYFQLDAGFAPKHIESLAPIVASLAGR